MSDQNIYSVIEVSSHEAEKFLQGQLTCDVSKVTEEHYSFAAHCNPKGRIISLFYLFKIQANFYLYLPSDLAAIALANLKKYAVFSKVKVQIMEDPSAIIAIITQQLPDINKIEAGIPTVYAATSGEFLPHDINLPQLGGVSFDKGCYTGQEIVARMHYLGTPKQQLYKLAYLGEDIPAPGTKLYAPDAPDSEIGVIVDAIKNNGEIQALLVLKNQFADLTEIVIGTTTVSISTCRPTASKGE